MAPEQIKKIVEAALMAVDKPLTLAHLHALFANEEEPVERPQVKDALNELQADYENRGVSVVEVASGYRVQIDQEVAPWISMLFEERPPKYTRALLETLALVAYRQPITRSEIEEVRGVSVSTNIIKTLLEREWVRVVGHKEVPGRPAMYATTKEFLDYFNLRRIDELPPLSELKDLDSIAQEAGIEAVGETEMPPEQGDDTEAKDDSESDAEEELISQELSDDADHHDAGNVTLH